MLRTKFWIMWPIWLEGLEGVGCSCLGLELPLVGVAAAKGIGDTPPPKLDANMGGEGAMKKAEAGDCWSRGLVEAPEDGSVAPVMSIGDTVADAELWMRCCDEEADDNADED